MEDFGIEISGVQKAVLRFQNFPDFARQRLLVTMQELEQKLEAAVRAQAPTRSGALRALIGGRVYEHGDRIAAVVGVHRPSADEAKKAAALEYGSRGSNIVVRAHQQSLDHFMARAISPRMVNVPQYSRKPNIAAHRYLRDPVEAMRGEAIEKMRAAIAAAAKDAGAG